MEKIDPILLIASLVKENFNFVVQKLYVYEKTVAFIGALAFILL